MIVDSFEKWQEELQNTFPYYELLNTEVVYDFFLIIERWTDVDWIAQVFGYVPSMQQKKIIHVQQRGLIFFLMSCMRLANHSLGYWECL
jgi:hypothetical protein